MNKHKDKETGRVAIVTGATGGLGSAMALAFAEEGTKVVVNYNRSKDKAESISNQINENIPNMAFPFKADVGNYPEVLAMVDKTLETWGRIDILVNNAGCWPPKESGFATGYKREGVLIVDMGHDEWEWYLASQLTGPFNCIKAVADPMIKQGGGHIINIGGGIGLRGRTGNSGYAAAKGGLLGVSRTAALELGQYNIKVNMAIPGPVNHPSVSWVFREGEVGGGLLGRNQTPEEFALFVVNMTHYENISGQMFFAENRIMI
jgi:3-oxoacyl-[acyl-carrier protein] reductase